MIDVEDNDINTNTGNAGISNSIGELISRFFYYWPLLILSVIVCLAIAYTFLRYTIPIYKVETTLMIKDDKKSAGAGTDILNQIDAFGNTKVVESEIALLRSRKLMAVVVDRLNLVVNYQNEGRIITSDAYTNRPVDIIAVKLNKDLESQTLQLTFTDASHYKLLNEITGLVVSGPLDQLQRNKFGIYKILRNSNFKRNAIVNAVIRSQETLVSQCLSRLNVGLQANQSSVISLSYTETVPERGKDVLNTLVQVYNEAGLADKNKTVQNTIQFIDERLKLISGELTEVEKNEEEFKSSRGLTDIDSDASLFLDNVKANDLKVNEVDLQISVLKGVERYVNSDTPGEKLPALMGISDPVLLAQITQLADLQLKRDQLLATTQATNPLVEPIIRQVETTRAGIKTSIRNIAAALQNTKRTLKVNDAGYQASIKKIPGEQRQFISIKRQQTLKESLYLYLLQKKEEAALSYASSVADSRVVDDAYYNKSPIAPNRSSTYLMALMVGLVLPAAYIYGKSMFNNKVAQLSDVTKVTNVPVLGEVVYEAGTDPIVDFGNSRTAIAEQFRAIRTNLQFIHEKPVKGQGNVTLFTSSMADEGKSFVASNLAVAIAISGKKTVLLEMDLRKPKISKYLKLSNTNGFSNYLIGDAVITDIIKPSGVNNNLFVISSGPIPPNPSELLVRPEIDEMITYLRANFDEVLIDTGPIGLVTDAQILARVADATIYLLRQGVTYKRQIYSLDDLFRKKKFPRLNVVLNGVEIGGQYDYGYGYGYYSNHHREHIFSLKYLFKNFLKRLY